MDGSAPPIREVSPYAPPVSRDEPTRPFRFRLAHLLLLVTFVCIVLACTKSEHAMFIIVAALITNLLGVIVGVIITSVFRLPNDGSAPPGCDADDDLETSEQGG